MVVDLYDFYSLVELSDGVAWERPEKVIGDIFADQHELFELVKDTELTIIV